ncbi:SirB1 family protein [Otariodibacter sp.]|uniref:SirB1 family protein n=1 Tax=Otariodibacter sp. TaxID=3030919 RepID=UPI00261A080A|nr:SirB1 family protein [Otariodibacter sp.]
MDEIIKSFEFSQKERNELQRFLYKELIRLATLIDPDVSEPQIYGLVSALVKKARYEVNGTNDDERIDQLLYFLYQEQGFHCHSEEYFYTDNLLLHKILRSHRGMPVSLGAILLYLASVLDLPLYPVNFPTQFIVRAEITHNSGRKETRFINPWDGSYLSFDKMSKWLEGELGFGVELKREFLQIATKEEVLERLETIFKMALTREGKYEETLRLIEYRLMLTPEDPYEIRDRGMVLASMDCFQAACDDLSYFIDQCPDDPSAMMLKLEIANLEKQSKANVLH